MRGEILSQRQKVAFAVLVVLLLPAAGQSLGSWCNNGTGNCMLDDGTDPKCYTPPPQSATCEPQECNKCKKSPCYVSSGVYTTSAVDLQIPTAGFPLELSRSYSSFNRFDGPLGVGWSSSLLARAHLAVFLFSAPDVVQSEADLTMPDGARYRFTKNPDGSFTPSPGRHDNLVANPDGTFDMTLQRGRSVYHFNEDGSIGWMADDFGNRLEYAYDGSGVLTRVADGSGSGHYFDIYWGADGRLSSIVDHTGRTVEYRYNGAGNLISVADPLGRMTNYSYTQGKYVPLLSQVRDNWDRVITTITYDSADRTKSYTEAGETWTYTYAYQGSPSKTAKADSLGNTYVFTYDSNGLVTSEVAPGGATKTTSYYADGSIQQLTDAIAVKTFYTYDAQGRLLSKTIDYQGPNSIRFDYTYDPNSANGVTAIIARNPQSNAVDPSFRSWRYEYYPATAQAPGALWKTILLEADGQTEDLLETLEYDSKGRRTSSKDSTGAETTFVYDEFGNQVEVLQPANNSSGLRPAYRYSYDSLGRVTAATDPMGRRSETAYDELGRTLLLAETSESDPALDFVTSFHYDEFDPSTELLAMSVTDPNSNAARFERDAFARDVRLIDQIGAVTIRSYERGLLKSITDANGNRTIFGFDASRRLSSTTFPDGASELYGYRADGKKAWTRDRTSTQVNLTYDSLGRLSSKSYSGGTSIQFAYVGELLSRIDDSSSDPPETHVITYDDDYQVATIQEGGRGTLSFMYSAGGEVTSVSVEGGPSTSYTYYPDHSIQSMAWSAVPSGAFEYQYDLRGHIVSITLPNGQQRLYTYDEFGRLRILRNEHPTAGLLAEFDYRYDEVDIATGIPVRGMRTSTVQTFPALGLAGALSRFHYDSSYQLTGVDYEQGLETGGSAYRWQYDQIGNRVNESVDGVARSFEYQRLAGREGNWNRLLADGLATYTYDANGSLASETRAGVATSFAADREGRLIQISGASQASYSYDFEGRRSTERSGSTTEHFLYDGMDLIAVRGDVSMDFLMGPGLDAPLAMLRDGEVTYFNVDGLNSVVAANSPDGEVAHAVAFDPWGGERAELGSANYPFGFTGRERAAAGLVYSRARFLDPSVGRFIEEDPLRSSSPTLTRLYDYVRSNPILFRDPTGLCELLMYDVWLPMMPTTTAQRSCEGLANCTVWGSFALLCPCVCSGGSWQMVTLGMATAAVYRSDNTATTRVHEQGHINDIRSSFCGYLDNLEAKEFENKAGCDAACAFQQSRLDRLADLWKANSSCQRDGRHCPPR
jgi:RHS repeat-associated protein